MNLSKMFDDQVHSSYAYRQEEYESSFDWQTVRLLFAKNYTKRNLKSHIPKIIHQIWLGSTVPERYMKFMWSWKKYHPTWQYKLWTDADINSIKITKRDVFNKATNNGMRSDILRYEILKEYGGLYVDTDFECLRPFDNLMYLDFFTGAGYDTKLQLYIGLIASIPNHPIINSCINSIGDYSGNKGSVIMNTTGANVFTKAFLDNTNFNSERIVAFPTDFFYPLPNSLRKENINPYDFVKSCSYAIHHWAVSWIKNKQI